MPEETSFSVSGFFDSPTNTVSYLIADRRAGVAAIVDPVLDFEPRAGRTSTASADRLLAAAKGLRVEWILETHAHADHLSAAGYLKDKLGAPIAIGAEIGGVQRTWAAVYDIPTAELDGRAFDRLFKDGERFALGGVEIEVIHTPGHTPACVSYIARPPAAPAAALVGDTLFMPDYGTARTDFPGGDARTLYRSIRRLLDLPPDTRIFVGHDYPPDRRGPAWETTVAEQRRSNPHVKDGVAEAEFVALRTERDRTLSVPALILPALQVNIRGGRLPSPAANGVVYLKTPLNRI